MDKLDLPTAEALIDFCGNGAVSDGLAQQQLQGTVALHNMLAEHQLAYLADEVGMGKTYIALGVVALMRRFQPALRVLYLLPKNNVRDKWQKDYRSFIDKNYLLHDGIVKGFGSAPAAPYRLCGSLSDLVQAVATNSARDYFICASAFSLPLSGNRSDLMSKLNHFRNELPQNSLKVEELIEQLKRLDPDDSTLPDFKLKVKRCWANALNTILPPFDLVVVDEAHNYRRGLQSADRNQLLATVLGTNKNSTLRVKRVLLLSATPFDRDIGQLQRQLELFGKEALLDVPVGASWAQVHAALAPFMVRRLNSLQLGDKAHTRNMYRTEHRSGPMAEIELGLKQQLFAALLQKKVSESLNENNSGKFELGMLASFESYLPANEGKSVQFDGTDEQTSAPDGRDRDAADRTIVELLVNDYQARFHQFPPHPKMDEVARRAAVSAFDRNKKQLIFVRRVGSVGELKAKIEDSYNSWIGRYVASDLAVAQCFSEYNKLVGERQHAQLDDEQDGDKANASSFFAWFYRGNNELLAKASAQLQTTPFNFRNMLSAASMMFSTNWSTLPGMPPPQQVNLSALTNLPSLPASPTRAQRFERAQYAYLRAVALSPAVTQARVAQRILAVAFGDVKTGPDGSEITGLVDEMCQQTFWEALRAQPVLATLSLKWTPETFNLLAGDDDTVAEQLIRRTLIHHRLTAAVCRLDHPFIDLYSLRASREKSDEGSADDNLIEAFAAKLLDQSKFPDAFSSYVLLRDLTANLELLLKQNFEDVGEKSAAELTAYLTRQLQPLSPILGATGENSASRSAIARKFRMPGYPRVLVSTDVFQEGEDLHTFCDSVIHYGISASPIALEQKVGRVDRIASLSHRAMNEATDEHERHFIQVGFPHIRESLEFLQVRQAARNLNQFHLSMNKVGVQAPRHTTEVELAQQLLDTSPIEAPISEKLVSPFEILQPALNGADRRDELAQAQQLLNVQIAHGRCLVEACLSTEIGCSMSMRLKAGKLQWDSGNGLNVALRGAHGRPHLLLSISARGRCTFDAGAASLPEALDYLRQLQADPLVRLQLASEGDDPLAHVVRRNAEIYAGATDILSAGEVTDLYRRVSNENWRGTSATTQPQNVQNMVANVCGQHGAYRIEQTGYNELNYHFDIEERQQRVQWEMYGSYVLLKAQVLSVEQTAELASYPGQLLLNTLRRNASFDMVDFHIGEDLALAVRALHPLHYLDQEELAFAASLVASEADRLRQIMFADPVDNDEETPVAAKQDNGLRLWAENNDAMCVIRDVLSVGPMSAADLIRETAYGLGYKRAVSGISTALEGVLLAAARRGIIIRKSGMVQLLAHSIADYDDEHLKDQFLAALSRQGSGLIEREQAIRAFARWMGFARTGPVIAGVGASLIRKLLRADRLFASGSQIRRCRG
jgi:superfamily II DNA or RNA helicase